MMRITNSMMTNNTKNNINLNKLYENDKNTQVATGQKISRPSDDPVIAIRALRFNTTISQLNQYKDKNIPDSDAWLKVTETALAQTDQIYDSIKGYLTTGASDDNTASDRQKILTSLKGLRDEFYATGNADYAGRTVFTGYRTGESLTFLATDTDKNCTYNIYQELTAKDLDEITYISTDDSTDSDDETRVASDTLSRIRLPYDDVDNGNITISYMDNSTTPATAKSVTATSQSIAGKTQEEIDDIYTSVKLDPDSAVLIPETGEIILGKNVAETLKSDDTSDISMSYEKSSWQTGDIRPEHYFACVKTEKGKQVYYNYDKLADGSPDPSSPNFQNQDIEVEISFNQKITINTHASDVYSYNIGRDLDDLIAATQDVVNIQEKIDKLESELGKATDETKKSKIQDQLDSANKEFSLKKNKMQKLFSKALDTFDGYADNNNVAISNVGSISSRLQITKERVTDQLESFTELADENININLTDASIDLKNAELALQAAQLAASKIAQQSLLNYL